ncbi:MAG: hypothetical protein Q8P67_14960 [archaeon]|nr:hypothetical protein [archaeon]
MNREERVLKRKEIEMGKNLFSLVCSQKSTKNREENIFWHSHEDFPSPANEEPHWPAKKPALKDGVNGGQRAQTEQKKFWLLPTDPFIFHCWFFFLDNLFGRSSNSKEGQKRNPGKKVVYKIGRNNGRTFIL